MGIELAGKILRLFRGRPGLIAVQGDGNQFSPHEGNITEEMLQAEHLSQKRCLGFYLMTPDERVYAACVDFDNKPESPDPCWKDKAERMYYAIQSSGLSPLIEVSQSGSAAHVWLFFDEPVPAWMPRAFFSGLGNKLNIPTPEIYPRQGRLTGKRVGSLVRYPMWHKSHFIEPEDGWDDPWQAAVALDSTLQVSATTLLHCAFELGLGVLREPQSSRSDGDGLPVRVMQLISDDASLLGRRWAGDTSGMRDKSTSAIAMSIATELVRLYVPTPVIEQTVRVWCDQNGAEEKGARDDWVGLTVLKAYDFVADRTEERSIKSPATFETASYEFLDSLESPEPRYMPSGIRGLDEVMDGVSPGEMCVIAAPPSHGKSAFGIQWLASLARSGVPGLLISEEMSSRLIGERRCHSIIGDTLANNKVDEYRTAIRKFHLMAAPTYIVEHCSNIGRAESVIDQMSKLYGVRAVAVDYIQLLGSKNASRYEVVTEVSRRLKQAAGRNSVAMFVMSQLNRESEKRTASDGRWKPKLTDLRESGQIEQDADTVIFLRWPNMDESTTHDRSDYLLRVMKRRNGPIRSVGQGRAPGAVHIQFNPERQLFE